MKSQQHTHVALNLSYVLHERSDSETIKQYVRAQEAELHRIAKDTRKLAGLSDAKLLDRLVVLDDSELSTAPATGCNIVSVNLGAIDLLPRLLHLAGRWPPDAGSVSSTLDGLPKPGGLTHIFFGAPAELHMPTVQTDLPKQALFASAVLRPGYSSVLLRATLLDTDAATGVPDWRQAIRLAEQAIREFPLQWWCDRPLWPRTVEETLPEFQAAGNGTIACGL